MICTALQDLLATLQSINGPDKAATPPTELTEGINFELLIKEMENIVIERRIRAEPPLQPLWESAIRRRQEAAVQEKEGEASTAAFVRCPSADHDYPDLNSNSDPPRARSSIPTVTVVEALIEGHLSEVGDRPEDGSIHDASAHSSSSETVLADKGPRRRTTSARTFIRVIPRPVNEAQLDQADES